MTLEILTKFNWVSCERVPFAGTEDWVEVAKLRHSESYEWADFNAFYSTSARRYFWHGNSGCSCNSWEDNIDSAADFENGDRDALLRAWKTFAKEKDWCINTASRIDGVTRISAFKVA